MISTDQIQIYGIPKSVLQLEQGMWPSNLILAYSRRSILQTYIIYFSEFHWHPLAVFVGRKHVYTTLCAGSIPREYIAQRYVPNKHLINRGIFFHLDPNTPIWCWCSF